MEKKSAILQRVVGLLKLLRILSGFPLCVFKYTMITVIFHIIKNNNGAAAV